MTLRERIHDRLKKIVRSKWPEAASVSFSVERPKDDRHGDYAANVAMQLAPVLKRNPLDIAQEVASAFSEARPKLAAVGKVEAVPPGFVNFSLDDVWLGRQVPAILKAKASFGRSKIGQGKRILLEFISANPTGPLTLANGRGGFFGDVLANVLVLAGFRVRREYYVNDQGRQVDILAESVLRRYWQEQGITIDYPDYCYQGDYVRELGRQLYLPNYNLAKSTLEAVRDKIKDRIVAKMLKDIQRVIRDRMGIRFDTYFSEQALYRLGHVDRALKLLTEKQLTYEKEGAIWMKTIQFGDEKDRVLKKSTGEPTYFLSDIALRIERFGRRKFDREILILGADHHGYVGRMHAAMAALGFAGRLSILLVQFVRLLKAGQEVRMSKRAGTYVTMDDLLDEVPLDAARFFFLMYAGETHMDFNLDLAKERSEKNPVYYVQYAHARISSILRNAKPLFKRKRSRGKQALLQPAELALIRQLLRWPEVVEETAVDHAVQRLATYSLELARTFHDFYDRVRVIEGDVVSPRRLALAEATKNVLANVLRTMGIRAPDKM